MIYELKPPINTHLNMDCQFPEALAVFAGNNPGWIFVDDRDAPKAALVWAQGIDGFYLVGDAEAAVFREELDLLIDQVLGPRLHHLGVDWFEIGSDETWEAVIQAALGSRGLERSRQWVYTLRSQDIKSPTLPVEFNNFKLLRIDPHLLGNLTGNNKQFLLSRLTHFWGSLDAFLKVGLGYVLFNEEEIASVCCSGFVAGNIHAIDIETGKLHRRKGYAEAVARAFLVECSERRFQPYWDCMADNTASLRLAEKLGFTQNDAYTLYSFRL